MTLFEPFEDRQGRTLLWSLVRTPASGTATAYDFSARQWVPIAPFAAQPNGGAAPPAPAAGAFVPVPAPGQAYPATLAPMTRLPGFASHWLVAILPDAPEAPAGSVVSTLILDAATGETVRGPMPVGYAALRD